MDTDEFFGDDARGRDLRAVHEETERFFREYSVLVNESLLRVPPRLRSELLESLQEASNAFNRDEAAER